MSRWFRWYKGACENGKFRVVARNADVTVATVMGVWAILLEDASHPEHRGLATRGEPFYAAILDLDEPQVISILGAMEESGLISVGHGAITITKWKERQFETDTVDSTNAERQRRWRENRKQTEPTRPHNGAVTDDKRPDTDTDTETEKKKKDFRSVASRQRPLADQKFDEFKKAYPSRGPKRANPWQPARKLFDAAVKAGTDPDLIIAAARARVGFDIDNIGTEFTPQAVKWLRGKFYDDYQPPTDAATPEPPPGAPSDEELRRRYGGGNGDAGGTGEVEHKQTAGAGESLFRPPEAFCERENGGGFSGDRPRKPGMQSLGSIFRRTPALAASDVPDVHDGPGREDDGPDAMAAVVR